MSCSGNTFIEKRARGVRERKDREKKFQKGKRNLKKEKVDTREKKNHKKRVKDCPLIHLSP
jgi:hypothetical protein